MQGRHWPILALTVMAATAHAQTGYDTDTGSIIPSPKRARLSDTGSDQDRGRKTMAAFASCVVDRHGMSLEKVLRRSFAFESDKQWSDLADDDCLDSGQMAFKPYLLRDAIFIELYRRSKNGAASQRRRSPTATRYVSTGVPQAGEGEEQTTQRRLFAFADCIVRRDPGDAGTLVLADIGSDGETAALGTLRPAMSVCIDPTQKFVLSRLSLEGALAEILYRSAATPSAVEAR